jgi:hypothetical protein
MPFFGKSGEQIVTDKNMCLGFGNQVRIMEYGARKAMQYLYYLIDFSLA